MTTENQTEETTQTTETEYEKPNPVKNPRDISLSEIAKNVAKQHTTDFAEQAPVLDEETGIITEAPAPVTQANAPSTEETTTTTSSELPPQELEAAPAASTETGLDPAKMYKVKIDGQEMEVSGQKLIDAGYRTFQKETAADYRLKLAEEMLEQARQRAAAVEPQHQQQQQQQTQTNEPTDADLAKALQYGTPEESAAAITALRSRGVVDPRQIAMFVTQQVRAATRDELAFRDAEKFMNEEYADLLKNDYLKRLFINEEQRYRAPKERGGLADTRPYMDVYKEIGDNMRKAFNLPKPTTAVTTTTTSTASTNTASARQELKAKTAPVPRTAASRLQQAEGTSKAKTPSEIIAGMAASRGNNRLTQPRKES